jgi:hypothetical protein
MGWYCKLKIGKWAVISGNGESSGTPGSEEKIPSALRRRMGPLERLAVRCTLGVLEGSPSTDELIYCSRYGSVETLCALLRSIAVREPVSPMAFSASVHNAVPGLVGQVRQERFNYTAISAGRSTFSAGLIECCARLATEECRDVTLVLADMMLPAPYCEFAEKDASNLAVAMRLGLARQNGAATITAKPGATLLSTVLDGLKAGVSQISLDESLWIGSEA